MNILSASNLGEALAAWGNHEAKGRQKAAFAAAQLNINDKLACADFALRSRSPLVSSLLKREPRNTAFVELTPQELERIMLFDGRDINAWIEERHSLQDSSWLYIKTLLDAAAPPQGPLLISAKFRPPRKSLGPLILWDGWHRTAACLARFCMGKSSPITAFLVLTAQ